MTLNPGLIFMSTQEPEERISRHPSVVEDTFVKMALKQGISFHVLLVPGQTEQILPVKMNVGSVHVVLTAPKVVPHLA